MSTSLIKIPRARCAVEKYSAWHEKYGKHSKNSENTELKLLIFLKF